jgi:hypothetical protein
MPGGGPPIEYFLDGKGKVWKAKARWVARGDMQDTRGLGDTFAPTPMMTSLLFIVSLSVGLGWEVHAMDANSAFLVPKLKPGQEIYLRPPKGDERRADYLILLHRCIYGLCQSGKEWHELAKAQLLECGFVQSKADPCVFLLYDNVGALVVAVGLHVDDFMLGAEQSAMQEAKDKLKRRIDLGDDGRASWFLKIRFTWSADGKTLYMTQPDYIERIVEAAGLRLSDTERLPGAPGRVLLPAVTGDVDAPVDMEPFRKVLGMVSYVSAVLRPDITYHTAAVQRCAAEPRRRHWASLLHIVRYLAGTRYYGIRFSADLEEENPSRFRIVGYSDADHCRDPQTRRSISGGCILMNGGPLNWFSSMNKHMTRSTMESELSALDRAAKEALFVRKLAQECKVPGADIIEIYEDNQACERFANSSKVTKLNKHIDIKYHAVRDDVKRRRLAVVGVDTKSQVADIFTKALDAPTFERLRAMMGIVEVPVELRK